MSSSTMNQSQATPGGADIAGQLQRCETNLKLLLDATPDGIMIHRELRYVYANPAALKLLGRTQDEVVGRSPFELVPPRFRLLLAERIMEAYTRRAPMPEVEERLLHASGAEVPVEVVVVPVIFDGELATLVHIHDITMRRVLEVRLRAADRLASAGLVASGVEHEIHNPLASALSCLELLEKRLTEGPATPAPSPQEVAALVASVRADVERASGVIRDLCMFAKGQRTAPGRIDVHHILDTAVSFLGAEMRSRVNLIKHYRDVPNVLGHEARLAHVFLNLLLNAVQSMTHRLRGPCDLTLTTSLRGDRVIVEVQDTGVGLEEEQQSTVFEPLFTTKPDGLGLGLALSKELVAEDGGELSVRSVPGTGTTFTVALRSAPRKSLPSEGQPRLRGSGKQILVVGEEPRLVATLKMILSGHQTTIVRTGQEALQRLDAGDTYDVIVCDLLMPNVDGIDLHQHIKASHPGLESRLIFLTGDAFVSRTQEFLAAIPNHHLQKPFEPEELLDLIDAAT